MPVLLACPRWRHFGPASLPPEWCHLLFTLGVPNLHLFIVDFLFWLPDVSRKGGLLCSHLMFTFSKTSTSFKNWQVQKFSTYTTLKRSKRYLLTIMTQHNDTHHDDCQHDESQHNGTQRNDTQHNSCQVSQFSHYAECRYAACRGTLKVTFLNKQPVL